MIYVIAHPEFIYDYCSFFKQPVQKTFEVCYFFHQLLTSLVIEDFWLVIERFWV